MKLKTVILVFLILCMFQASVVSGHANGHYTTNHRNHFNNIRSNDNAFPKFNNILPVNNTNDNSFTVVNPHIGNSYYYGEPTNQKIKLINNNNAKDPTYAKLVAFIKADPTDKKLYSSQYMCDMFAQDVHNNAEKAGIKAAWVALVLVNPDDEQFCTAFHTTDKGLVYIDCTGEDHKITTSCDTIVNVKVGVKYHPLSLYPPFDRDYTQGTIQKFDIFW
jgi:hypothetical protein